MIIMQDETIIEYLKNAFEAFQNWQFKKFRQYLNDAWTMLETYPQNHPLRGEWILIESLIYLTDPQKLIEKFQFAFSLIGGHSKLFNKKISMNLDFYHVFGIYYRPGKADEIAILLDEASELFEKLTGGGTETALCYRAQLAHFRGDHQKSLTIAEKAYSVALDNQNHIVALCAAELIGNLAKHNGDNLLWNKMHTYIDGVIHSSQRRRICIEIAESIRTQMNMHIGVFTDIPDYIKNGNFDVIPQKTHPLGFVIANEKISPSLLYYAGITHIQYLFYNKQYINAINTIGMIRDVWHASPYAFSNVYLDFILAENYRMLGDMDSAHDLIAGAIEIIAQDKLWLIPAEFVLTSFGNFIIETTERYDPEAGNIIRDLGIDYWNKIDKLRSIVHQESLIPALNDREYEVALLAADRLSNSEIAKHLFISESTVKFHLSNIFGKLGIKKKAELAAALEKNVSNNFSLLKSRKEW